MRGVGSRARMPAVVLRRQELAGEEERPRSLGSASWEMETLTGSQPWKASPTHRHFRKFGTPWGPRACLRSSPKKQFTLSANPIAVYGIAFFDCASIIRKGCRPRKDQGTCKRDGRPADHCDSENLTHDALHIQGLKKFALGTVSCSVLGWM
jgi:hypothetical protein